MKVNFISPATPVLTALTLALGLIAPQAAKAQAFVHPGCLEAPADFARMNTKVAIAQSPWILSYNKLVSSSYANPNYVPSPVPVVSRGLRPGTCPASETYPNAMRDAAAAYQLSLRWQITGDTACANAAIRILNAWAATCTQQCGDGNAFLLNIYGYQFACAGENMRGYSGWAAADFTKFKNFVNTVFVQPLALNWLNNHLGATCNSQYWTSWDWAAMACVMAYGVLADDRATYNIGLNYYKTGWAMGNINNAVPFLYNNGALGQGQESGRDQGHAGTEIAWGTALCQIAYNQGDDLFGYGNNKFLAMAEYFACYNLGNTVPYTSYTSCGGGTMAAIGSGGRGDNRPVWDAVFSYYNSRKLLATPYTQQYCARLSPEGGGGSYGGNSGGFDQLGYTTLTCTIDRAPVANGTYSVKNRASGKMLDNLGATNDGATVAQWGDGSSNNQKWVVTYQNNGYYKLSCVTGGKCLDSLGNTTDGSNMGQWGSGGSFNQQWMIVPMGSYYKIINRSTGKCLDTGGTTADGGVMKQYWSNPSINQQWQFVAP